jgi:alkanesulfonate monooxygenase SsuD/methylene tetrahydromethanopterin reductase-like flavin-dependent oxidoreductase (luciferase family)
MNPRLPFYQRMLVEAGFPEASQGTWSDAMIDGVVFWGNETRVAERIQEIFSFGASEVLVSPIGAGEDRSESIHRTTRLLAELAKSPA